tara:strand:- start:4189 stop:4434 length:246 start_codon:yes stop_codon:yes gene_type:complete
MNNKTPNKKIDEEEFLRQMRRNAVEKYKQELVDLIEERMQDIKEPNGLNNRMHAASDREQGIIRGMTNVKSLIQSHVIKVM